jgi:RNA polymerase nonessential primary-like sigma factor
MPTAKTNQTQPQPTLNADMVRTYLHEIGRVPLLTHEQEIIYGKQVQRMMSLLEAKEALSKQLGREPDRLDWADSVNLSENELDRALKTGDRAKRKMIEANLRLVVAIAKKYQKRNMEFLDSNSRRQSGIRKRCREI